MLQHHLEESVKRIEVAKEIREIMRQYGFEKAASHVVDFSLTVSLEVEVLRDLLRAIEQGSIEWE